MPPASLAPYITTFYHTRVTGRRGQSVEDWLHPESANLRIGQHAKAKAGIGNEPLAPVPRIVLSGPTCCATRFRQTPGRTWGIGFLPLGWARFVGGDAASYADRFVDAARDPALPGLARLERGLFREDENLEAEAAHLARGLEALPGGPVRDEAQIIAVHEALVSGSAGSVAEIAEACAMNIRTLERFCRRAFGFTPNVLLRRQRFLRSLARFMLDPSLAWIDTLDEHYYDQAHFVRDFKSFMTMTPSEYAALDKPILKAAAFARMKAAGQAMQVLHPPTAPAGAPD